MSTSVFALLSPSRLVAHLRSPLFRNAYALVLSTATTSGLGMVYWILAARYYSPEVVGLNSAALSTMFFLSNLSQLGLGYALNRFIPRLGHRTGRFILISYLVSLLATLMAGSIYLLGINLWSPSLGFIRSSSFYSLAYLLACMAWVIFTLQDNALIGLRQATCAIENTSMLC
jgi:O-antigen/teichoic acid export membrane protein